MKLLRIMFLLCILILSTGLISACSPLIKSTSTLSDVQPNAEITGIVKRIIDGDTFTLQNGNQETTIRLIGVNTPETNHPSKGAEPFGKEAKAYALQQLDGRTVIVRTDLQAYDKYQRLLGYVYFEDGTFWNEQLLREGYAQVMTVPPNDQFAKHFVQVQSEARNANKGLWASSREGNSNQTNQQQPKASSSKRVDSVADKDCADFTTQKEAQAFFIQMGGPKQDPHRLDLDGDGRVCERLP